MKFAVVFAVFLFNTANYANADPSPHEVPLNAIFSDHLPQFLPPMNLSTGELKLFAGHSLQLIKAKCPAVPAERLSLLNKYISKLISRGRPTPGASTSFRGLLSSITTCTQTQITEEEKANREKAFMRHLFQPFRPFPGRGLRPIQEETSTETEGKLITTSDDPQADGPVIHVFYSSSDPDDSGSSEGRNPFSIIGAILSFFTSIFSGIFGPPAQTNGTATPFAPKGPSPVPTSEAISSKLAPVSPTAGPLPTTAPEALPSGQATEQPKPASPVADVAAPAPRVKRQAGSPADITAPEERTAAAPIPGPVAFTMLVDNMCRVYCRECMDKTETIHFKAAAKELLRLIVTDTTGIELASKHFLEPAFMTALNEC